MGAQLEIGRVIAGESTSLTLKDPDKADENSVELILKRADKPDLPISLSKARNEVGTFAGEIPFSTSPAEIGNVQVDPVMPGETLTFHHADLAVVERRASGLLAEKPICGQMMTITAIDDKLDPDTQKLKIQNQANNTSVELTPTDKRVTAYEYQYTFRIGGPHTPASSTRIDAKPGDQLRLVLGDLPPLALTVTGLSLTPVLVGQTFQITLFDPTRSGAESISVDVVARHRKLTRRSFIATLSADIQHSGRFTGQVATACGTDAQPEKIDAPFRAHAGDTVVVKLDDRTTAQEVAQGVHASDVIVGEPLTARVVDLAPALVNTQQVAVEVKTGRPDQTPITMTLTRAQGGTQEFLGILSTAPAGDTNTPENTLRVLAEDKLTLIYKPQDGDDLSWQIDVYSQGRVNVCVAGGLTPGTPLEISVTDLDRIDDPAVTVFAVNTRTKQTMPVKLCRVAGDPGTFRGSIKTARKSLRDALTIEADDQVEVRYRDVKNEFHQDQLTVMQPRALSNSLNWTLGLNFLRSFTQPSRKPLLAELRCLEVRLQYYRLIERCASDRHRGDRIEGYLRRAHEAFTSMDLTSAWKALHGAERQEIYLIDATEAEGREHQIVADAKELLSDDQQASISKLLEKARNERKRAPAAQGWRGFVVQAMRTLQGHQDAYYIQQNMIRDRMVAVSIFLVILLIVFFQNLDGTRVADALVSNRGLKEIITEHALFQYGGAAIAADKDPAIRFAGETVVGAPLVLLVNDADAGKKGTIEAVLSCTDETKSLCPEEWPKSYKINKLKRSKGLFRAIFETGDDAPDPKNPGYFQLKSGAELLAKYKSARTGDNGRPLEVEGWTRMLDAKLVPTMDDPAVPSPRALVIAGCLLGAIGACLSTLMSMRSGSQVPNQLDSAIVTVLGRPVIGFTAALLLFIALNAKIINFDPTLTMYWLLSLISGFSDRLVLGVVSRIGGEGSDSQGSH